jgi:hypothetical protein
VGGQSRGAGTLFFGIAATVFLLVHLPFTWAALSGTESNPANDALPTHPAEWRHGGVRVRVWHRQT